MRARDVVAALRLEPHPEGGWYRETFRDTATDETGRARSTAIYYLLDLGETSEWHRVSDAAETWAWHAGAPLVLTVSPDGHDASAHWLGPNVLGREAPQFTVLAGWWQTATSLGEWTLVTCTVAPGFRFESFEMAPPGWRPTPRPPRSG